MERMAGPLKDYEAKRSAQATPEPWSGKAPDHGPLLFVVQKHAATNLHYDLRLELGGVLKSWAVPKGPSYDPAEKRFAAPTEDHPYDYGAFEGVIPAGQYGAGEVIVWDVGTWYPDEICSPTGEWHWEDPAWRAEIEAKALTGLNEGKLSVFIRGQKMHGSWALVKTKQGWLFFKHSDRWALWDLDPLRHEGSALTGRTLQDVARGAPPESGPAVPLATIIPSSKPEVFPSNLKPMKAEHGDKPFDHKNWIFEPKMDGIRVLAYVRAGKVRLITRNGLDQTSQFPEIARHLAEQRGHMILDGEIVAFEDGKPGFTPMMKRFHLKEAASLEAADRTWPCVFYAFDLLHLDGFDLRPLPTVERKRHLLAALLPTERVQYVEYLEEHGKTFFEAVVAAGFEGAMAKKADARYEPTGKSSPNWLKLKYTQTDEFVVGGFTHGEGGRSGVFGGLAVGTWSKDGLVYAGRVGTGFSDVGLEAFMAKLSPLISSKKPFNGPVEEEHLVTWVEPKLVIEVKFSEIMPSGHLRAPVFMRERPDVPPEDVGPIEVGFAKGSPAVAEVVAAVSSAVAADGQAVHSRGSSAEVDAVLSQLAGKEKNLKLEVAGDIIGLTNLDKVLWPKTEELEAFTKRDLLVYLAKVSPYMIPHTRRRPLTLIRWPNGIHGEKFFQKHWEQSRPEFVSVIPLWGDTNKKNQDYIDCDSLGTLLWCGQLGTLEFHIPAARIDPWPDGEAHSQNFADSEENIDRSILNYPDFIRFDIDPYIYSGLEKPGEEPELNREAFEKGKTVAFWIRDLIAPLGMKSFVKTTGKTGLHVFVPIIRDLDTPACREICMKLCHVILAQHPREVTTEWSVNKRTGKIFLDYNMNAMGKTLGAAYSPRALPNQSLSMPLTWEELESAYPEDFTMRNVFTWLDKRGDAWKDILEHKVDVAGLLAG